DHPADGLAAAGRAYDRAAAAFEAAGSRRGLAAVTLARAGVAALGGDHARARELAAEAERAFTELGAYLGRWMAATPGALAATAAGVMATDAMRAIGTWGSSDGCIAFAIGCARLLARSGRRALYRDGAIERAIALHRLAGELLGAMSIHVLAAQALVDEGDAL